MKWYKDRELLLKCLRNGTNNLILEEIRKLGKKTYKKFIYGSMIKIYKWPKNSRLALIDYESFKDFFSFGNPIENYVDFLKELQDKNGLNLKVIIISNESHTKYDEIKGYFKEFGFNEIPILLNNGKLGTYDCYVKFIENKLLRLRIEYFLRITNNRKVLSFKYSLLMDKLEVNTFMVNVSRYEYDIIKTT